MQIVSLWGLMDVVLHPKFAENRLVYLSYMKPLGNRRATLAVSRGRFDGTSLNDVTEIFVATNPTTAASSRLAFGLDGSLYVTTTADDMRAQDPREYGGKILRLRDDGSVPPDNPFVKRAGYLPEIYSLGHRSQVGIAVHPETGAALVHRAWAARRRRGQRDSAGPQLRMAGRELRPRLRRRPDVADAVAARLRAATVVWVPSIAITGIAFYTGDKFPGLERQRVRRRAAARPHLADRASRADRLQSRGEEIRRESMLTELRKRVRDVRQGADGLLYVLVEDDARPDRRRNCPAADRAGVF